MVIAFVDAVSSANTSGTLVQAVTLNTTSGYAILAVAVNRSSDLVKSVADTLGTNYSGLTAITLSGRGRLELWGGFAAGTSATNSITVTLSGTGTPSLGVSAAQYGISGGTGAFGLTSTNSNTGSAIIGTTSITTAMANDWIIGGWGTVGASEAMSGQAPTVLETQGTNGPTGTKLQVGEADSQQITNSGTATILSGSIASLNFLGYGSRGFRIHTFHIHAIPLSPNATSRKTLATHS